MGCFTFVLHLRNRDSSNNNNYKIIIIIIVIIILCSVGESYTLKKMVLYSTISGSLARNHRGTTLSAV